MENPFLVEARNHKAEADRNGRTALQAFLSAVAAFVLYGWSIEQSWCWWFWVAAVVALVGMTQALESRWFHRKAARIALEFYAYSNRSG